MRSELLLIWNVKFGAGEINSYALKITHFKKYCPNVNGV